MQLKFQHGGTTGQVLAKNSDDDNDVRWVNAEKEKNYIVAVTRIWHTIASAYTELLQLYSATALSGDKLSITEDGGILIGSGVHNVRVSGSIEIESITSGPKIASIFVNNTNNRRVKVTVKAFENSATLSIPIPTTILRVTEGDVLYLGIQGKDKDTVYANSSETFLCVEVVD